MNHTRTIAIIGATGAQGGGLARAALADPARRFAPRAITREPGSPAALALAAAGAAVACANLDDLDALAQAFSGAHGVFAITDYWAHHSPEKELAQARNVAAAARRAGVRHLVWSTLADTRELIAQDDARMPMLKGRYRVPHMDAKGEANAVFRDSGVPTTYLYTSFYWENLVTFGMGPQRAADGRLVLSLPLGERPLPCIAAEDIGACALALFEEGDAAIGRHVGISGQHLTGGEMAAALSRFLGEPVRYEPIAFPDYARLGFPGAEDLANMFQFKHDFNDFYLASRPVEATRRLHPALMDFDAWLRRHGEALARPLAASSSAAAAA